MENTIPELVPGIDILSELTAEEKKYSLSFFKNISVKRGEYISKEGEVCTRIYLVREGILRSYFNMDGKELTTFFNMEGTVATALRSFLKEVSAHENIQALLDCELFYIEKKDLNHLYEKVPKWNKIARLILENVYVKMEERSISLQYDTAKERYLNFLVEFPNVVNRIPLQYVASFLGITPETLSRIRKSFLK